MILPDDDIELVEFDVVEEPGAGCGGGLFAIAILLVVIVMLSLG